MCWCHDCVSYVDACKRDTQYIGKGKLARPYAGMWREYCKRRGIWDVTDEVPPCPPGTGAALPADLDAMYGSCFSCVAGRCM